MGDTTYITPANDYLAKPIAVAINDAGGSVVWAKKYFEGQGLLHRQLQALHHRLRGQPEQDHLCGQLLRCDGGFARRRLLTGVLVPINETDGLPNGIMIYDVPNDDFAGMSMNEDGSGGYLAIGTRDTAPLDTFQLLKVGQVGGNVDCLVEHDI